MKLVTGMVASLVIGTLSFGAFAAKEIQKEDVAKMNLTKVGSITTSRTTSPMDARRDLSKKADELGGKYFVVIAGQKNEKPYTLTLTFINNPVIKNGPVGPFFTADLLVLPVARPGLTPFIAAPTTPAGTPLSLQDSFYSCLRDSPRSFR